MLKYHLQHFFFCNVSFCFMLPLNSLSFDAFEMWCWRRLLESPLHSKEIKPVKSVLNIHWKEWCWSSNTLATWCEELSHWKRPWCWERSKAGREVGNKGWDGWMASSTQWTWVWASLGVGDGQGSLMCCSPWGYEWTELSDWTELCLCMSVGCVRKGLRNWHLNYLDS